MHDTIFGTIGAIPHEPDHIFDHFGSIFGCGTVVLGIPQPARIIQKMIENYRKWPQRHDMMIWKLKNRLTRRVSKSWPRILSFLERSDQYLMSELHLQVILGHISRTQSRIPPGDMLILMPKMKDLEVWSHDMMTWKKNSCTIWKVWRSLMSDTIFRTIGPKLNELDQKNEKKNFKKFP